MKAILKMIAKLGWESIFTKMVISMKENGKMICTMEVENKHIMMARVLKAIGVMMKKMVKEFLKTKRAKNGNKYGIKVQKFHSRN